MDDKSVLEVAQALGSETRLNLIKVIGNKSLSLYELKNIFTFMHRESIYRALEKLTEAGILKKDYNETKKRYEYTVVNPQIQLNIITEEQDKQKDSKFQEKYPVYINIQRQLKGGEFFYVSNYKILKDYDKFYTEIHEESEEITPEKILAHLKTLSWRKGEYTKQHWGNWLHSISPYVGRMTPSLAHWLVKSSTKPGQVILDPFCGIGTVCLEADLFRRKAVGVDLNPYAALISKSKFERKPIQEHLDFLRDVRLNTSKIKLEDINSYVRQFFHDETLKEIIALKELLLKEERYFLLACLMGILHGNRPGYLSAWTGCIIPMSPRKKEHPNFDPSRDIPEYRAVIPRMAAKVKRMYMNKFPLKTKTEIYERDSRDLSFLKDNSIDAVCSSPPYYHTLDYVGANRLRLAIMGFDEKERENLKENLIQQRYTYLQEMKKVGKELHRVLKPNAPILFVLGDVHVGKLDINTAEDIGKLFEEIGFKKIGIVDDILPRNKCAVQNGNHRTKMDRILILKTIK